MGHYHGIHGFETFSKRKAVFRQARYCLPPLFRPPYSPVLKHLIRALIRE